MKAKKKELGKSQIEIDFELDVEEFQKHFDRAILNLKENIKMDGFRKGHVPKEMVEKKIGNENLLMEAGDLAVKESYTKYVNENNIEPIDHPEVKITKIAKGSPFLFTVKVSVIPEITLPDYKEIVSSIKEQDIAVDEKEIEETLRYLQKLRSKFSQADRGAELKDFVELEYQNEHINGGKYIKDRFILGEGGFMEDFQENIVGMKAGHEKEFSAKFPENTPNKELAGKEANFKVKMVSVQKMDLPEIDDVFAKSLGSFDNLTALKKNLHEGISAEKKDNEKYRKRSEMLRKISEKADIDIPETMIAHEQARLFEELKNQVAQDANTDFVQYLASLKKTEEQVRQSFRLEAEKKIKNFLVLREIGKREHIEFSKEELENEMNKELRRYSKEQSDKIDIDRLKEYTKGKIYNEKVFQKLDIFGAGS